MENKEPSPKDRRMKSVQDIPEWFKEEISVFLLQKGYSENDWSYDGITDGMVQAFKLLSIPTNAAKIPEVAKLIEKIKEIKDYAQEVMQTNPSERVSLDELWVKQNCEDALAPFQGGE